MTFLNDLFERSLSSIHIQTQIMSKPQSNTPPYTIAKRTSTAIPNKIPKQYSNIAGMQRGTEVLDWDPYQNLTLQKPQSLIQRKLQLLRRLLRQQRKRNHNFIVPTINPKSPSSSHNTCNDAPSTLGNRDINTEGMYEHVWIVFSRERLRTVRRAVALLPSFCDALVEGVVAIIGDEGRRRGFVDALWRWSVYP